MEERLQRFLARAGISSRRAAEEIILAGRVKVNGSLVSALGAKIDALRDRVTLDGRPIAAPIEHTYVLLHKPVGFVTTMHDPQGRPRVIDLLPAGGTRIYPVGRLDLDTSGLLLLTDDGNLTHSLLHPSHGVWKTYEAAVRGEPSGSILSRLSRGVQLEDGMTAPARVKILDHKVGYATIELRIHEGRKRQIRRMLAAVGLPVIALKRTAFAGLILGDLPEGDWRPLTRVEVESLRNMGEAPGSAPSPPG